MAGRHKRGRPRSQTALLPAAVEDYVGPHNVARVIEMYVSGLDMVALGFAKSVPAATGRPAYAPDDLLRLYLYAYLNRLGGSRKLEVECQRNLELMWLMGELVPDHKTIAEFRRVNAAAFGRVCAEFVEFLREAKLVGGEEPVVTIDGSKFKANAARHSVVNAEQLAKQREKVEKKIAEYLEELDEADRQDQGQPTAAQIEGALEKLRERQQKLEQAQEELAAREERKGKKETPRVGLVDHDCVLLSGKRGGLVGYNVQHAVDAQHKLIVAHEVTTCRNDHTSLEPLALAAQAALKAQSMIAVADCGYLNGKQAQACEERGIRPVVPLPQAANTHGTQFYPKSMFAYDAPSDSYRCPAAAILKRVKRLNTHQANRYETNACRTCAQKPRCTPGVRRAIERSWFTPAAERADQRARSEPRLMRLRSASVEHPFGNLKAMLRGGFVLRTLSKVRGEMALAVLAYNLKRALSLLRPERLMQLLRMRSVAAPA